MRGDFKIDGVWYKAAGGNLPNQSLANQMASKVGQGVSQYGDLTNWSAWIQENWQEGVGNLNPAVNSGTLYSEAETRVPNQIILRGLLKQVDTKVAASTTLDCKFNPTNMVGAFVCGSALANTKAAIEFTTPAVLNSTTFWAHVWISCPVGTQILFEVRNNSAGSPGGTVHTSATITQGQAFPAYAWMGAQLAYSGTLAINQIYWLCVSTTSGTFNVGYGTSGYNVDSKLLVSAVWTAQVGKYMAYLTTAHQFVNAVGNNTGSGFFRFTNNVSSALYSYAGQRLYKYSTANDNWSLVGTVGGYRGQVGQMAGTVYFGDDEPLIASAYTVSSAEVITNTGVGATHYLSAGGYIWRCLGGTTLGYSSDGTNFTSTAEMVVGNYDHYVTGMCQMGENMFVSTNEGLYRIAPGDFAVPVMPYGSTRDSNGRSMVNHEGALYVAADNRVYRFTEDLQRQDIWLSRDDDFLTARVGAIQSLCVCNSWVLAFVGDKGGNSKPTVWAFQDNHWHCIASLPDAAIQGTDNNLICYSCFYDAATDYLWLMTPQGVTYKLYMPGTTINPYNDTTTRYAASAWMEWDWFDSPIKEADKDYDSVSIIGENISATCPVLVYWKDDASADWELLGSCTANFTELRWTLASLTRPNTKRLKLGLLLQTSSGASTARIRSFRVKYHLMVKDWFRWSLAVDVSGRSIALQEVTDGTVHTLTAAQIKSNLDVVVKAVAPVVYQDVGGTQYEVKVADANFSWVKHEYNENTADEWWEGVYRITLEQVTTGTYS